MTQSAAVIQVTSADLPLSCPAPDAEVWAMHPRVFLTFEHSNRTTCPYCGAIYELVDKADTHAV
ncbi:MAG: zinc-finger domain-containing protein [Pseudomonadota bacterium]